MRRTYRTMKSFFIRDLGVLVVWYALLIMIGIFIGWLWAFIALSALYFTTFALLWYAIILGEKSDKADKDAHA